MFLQPKYLVAAVGALVLLGLLIWIAALRVEVAGKTAEINKQKGLVLEAKTELETSKTALAQSQFDLGKKQTELNACNESVANLTNGVAGLNAQVDKLMKDSGYWYGIAKRREKELLDMRVVDPLGLVSKGGVIDLTSSQNAIRGINSLMVGPAPAPAK